MGAIPLLILTLTSLEVCPDSWEDDVEDAEDHDEAAEQKVATASPKPTELAADVRTSSTTSS